jgi:hypothetical protein
LAVSYVGDLAYLKLTVVGMALAAAHPSEFIRARMLPVVVKQGREFYHRVPTITSAEANLVCTVSYEGSHNGFKLIVVKRPESAVRLDSAVFT